MQVQVRINQPEAIRRGFNAHSTTKLEVDVANLTQPQRKILALRFTNGELEFQSSPDGWYAGIRQPDVAGLVEYLDACAAHETAKEEQQAIADKAREAKRAEWQALLQQPDDQFIVKGVQQGSLYPSGNVGTHGTEAYNVRDIKAELWDYKVPGYTTFSSDWSDTNYGMDAYLAKREAVTNIVQSHNQPIYEAHHAEQSAIKAQKQREETARNERRDAQLRDAIARLGTDPQKGRLAAGMLDLNEEAIPFIIQEMFAQLAEFAAYSKITLQEVRDCLPEDWYEPETEKVKFHDPEKADTCTDEEWLLMEKIRVIVPDAEIEINQHCGYIDWSKSGYAASIFRNSIDVTLTLGEVTATRKFASPKADE